MANLPARPYRKSDAERLEINLASVCEMLDKFHMTPQDLLSGLRYQEPARSTGRKVWRRPQRLAGRMKYISAIPQKALNGPMGRTSPPSRFV